ncbi:MAG: hypothetical protein HY699_18835 [Deltaproteobacteria bacterium]|nr:hypothetical protein [Deltaproteobacteria bacterium]
MWLRRSALLAALALASGCGGTVPSGAPAALSFTAPADQQLSLAGAVSVVLRLPANATAGSLQLSVDGVLVSGVHVENGEAHANLVNVAPGHHQLSAQMRAGGAMLHAQVSFETISLNHPDQCEVLNDAECLLPYPSARFLAPADTPTGYRIDFPAAGMPMQNGRRLPPEAYSVLDGFSPTVQILMHFPGGVDVVASNAARLHSGTRTYDLRSLDLDSPTVLLDADSGERILHFAETDARAADDPGRQVLFLRPGKSLTPGHRYLVAARNLRHPDGSPVQAEPVFAALRDRRPTDIAAVASRRDHFEELFALLGSNGIDRAGLVLAFDFVVQSEHGLTAQMLAMRDQAFAWLDGETTAGHATFTVENLIENDCSQPGARVWRQVEGSYQVPLFLTSDPVAHPVTPGVLNVSAGGTPVANGFTAPPFTIAIPCAALAGGGTPKHPLILGHGLFGDGRGMIEGLVNDPHLDGIDYIAGATDWRGLSAPDLEGSMSSFIVSQIVFKLQNIAALADRLRQGQLNTLVLARMLKTAAFHVDPAFRTPAGVGVLAGPEQEAYYFGASLGGIMGLMFAALSPDITSANVDVPAINFSLLLQRATPFLEFELALKLTGITDPMQTALGIGLIHELWVRGESAAYATHITTNPLPGTNAKNILMTMAWLDQQVSNAGTEVAARTLALPNLAGSLMHDLAQIPDRPGPLPSALVVYDTGSFDLSNPEHAPFVPPLANLQPEPNPCDPHGLRGFIPASIEQLLHFLQPGGEIVNFCDGTCDAGGPRELPFGAAAPCDPLGS